MNNSDAVIVLIFSSAAAVVTSVSLLLELRFWPKTKTKLKRIKATAKQSKITNKNKQKQTSQKNSMKYNNIQWCKYCNKTDQIDGNNCKTCLNKDTF